MPLLGRAAREAMEHSRGILSSAVGIGVGVGVGLSLAVSAGFSAASGPGGDSSRGPTPAELEAELRRQVVKGRHTGVSFEDFPYYISEEMRLALTSAAYPYLNQTVLPKQIDLHAGTSRTILLCGQSELCLRSLAKAVAHQFNSRLLILDVMELAKLIKHKYGRPENSRAKIFEKSIAESTFDRLYGWIESSGWTKSSKCLPEKSEPIETVVPSWNVDEGILMRSLCKVLVSVSESSPVTLYIRDVDVFLGYSERVNSLFQEMLNKLSGRVLIIGSLFLKDDQDSNNVDKAVSDLFPYILQTKPPKEKSQYKKWKKQMKTDVAKCETDMFVKLVYDVLTANDLDCDDLNAVSTNDYEAIQTYLFDILPLAVSYHLMTDKNPEYKNGKLMISSTSLSHGLKIFKESNCGKDTVDGSNKVKDNEYEKRIRESVIPADKIGVTFDDIGALDDIKESIQELVMLPLQRPDLFNNGGLLKPCRGILLFGPPGTGKTMLAKAIADEAGASFINISSTSLGSYWHADAEKSIRAMFSIAEKIAPAIIFLDAVDGMLGSRSRSTEFMRHWDAALSKSDVKILVLAATNRPFDLDEAIIRRFEHRILVGLPTLESRELILKKLLSKEKVENIEFKELARLTEGYSGSDLKYLCETAAYRPLREVLQKEKETNKDKMEKQPQDKKDEQVAGKNERAESSQKGEKDAVNNEQQPGKPKKQGSGSGKGKPVKGAKSETKETIAVRPLTMDDLKQAKAQVGPSFASDGIVMHEIKKWNELYGKGGSRKRHQPTYFL